MINIKFHNLPWEFTRAGVATFDPFHTRVLFHDLGNILGCSPSVPQLFILGDTKDCKLVYDGEQTSVTTVPVQIIVEWTGDSLLIGTKSKIAHALCNFLQAYNLQKDALVLFQQIPVGDAFVEKSGKIISVPQLTQRPHDFLGFTKR